MDMIKLMEQRHSVRQYQKRVIEPETQAALKELIEKINKEVNLHVQIFFNEPRCFNSMMARYGKFSGVENYISLVGKKSNNLDETLGYYGEDLVLKAQELGLNTCWVAMSHGKSCAEIKKGEKEVCLISLGYGLNQGVPHKSKELKEVCNVSEDMPDWFLNGVKAALLAPTAMNQQKFFFEWVGGDTVKASCGRGFYTKLDLGIVKYHFELAGKKIMDSL